MSDYIEGEATALAVRDEAPPSPALFGSNDPVEVVQRAVRVADALKAVVVSKRLITSIGGKPYPQVEAWLTLAAMLRLTTICEWTREVADGWEARVYVRDAQGNMIGAAEAQCLSSESSKKKWEGYAIRSMAQTRATSKALRSVLGFVMVLAGYQATPAEEMPDDPPPPRTATAGTGPTKAQTRAAGVNAGEAPCPQCHAPAGKPHATACTVGRPPDPGRPQQVAADAARATPRAGCLASCTLVDHARDCANGPPSEGKRRLMFALHGELKHNDAARHDIYGAVAGVGSATELTRATCDLVIGHLEELKASAL